MLCLLQNDQRQINDVAHIRPPLVLPAWVWHLGQSRRSCEFIPVVGRPTLDETAVLPVVMAGYPRLVMSEQRKTWMAGLSPAMTMRQSRSLVLVRHRLSPTHWA
jgi:hypothetical protein